MPTPTDPESLAKRLALELLARHYAMRASEDGRLELCRGSHTCLMLWGPDALGRLPDLGAIGNADVLLLGGTKDLRGPFKKACPMLTEGRVHLFHIDDAGDVWQGDFGKPGQLGPLLRRRDALPKLRSEDFETQVEQYERGVQSHKAEAETFLGRFNARTPVATYAIAATIAVVFGLEAVWGGSTSTPTLLHMGALVRQQVLAEPWRLLSCTFLHAGLMHFAFNTYVLISLGRSLERLLGAQRFLVLYVAAALGGSLASATLLGEGISVGASGAVWGLLAAEAVLVYRPAGLLPTAALPAMKRAALFNLGINIVNSFRPVVDWAAHLGGGLVGAALIVTGVLTLGLPRLADATDEDAPKDRPPGWLRPAAVVLSVLLAVGGVLGIAMGQPWAMDEERPLEEVVLGTTGLRVDLPANLVEREANEEDGFFVGVYGDMMVDSMVIDVSAGQFDPPLSDEELRIEHESLPSMMEEAIPPGSKEIAEAEQIREGDTVYRLTLHELSNGLILETAVVVSPRVEGRVAVITFEGAHRGSNVGLAERTVRTISP